MLCETCRGSPIPGMVVAEVSADPDGRPQTMYVPCPQWLHRRHRELL
jgi:hypothetical protein